MILGLLDHPMLIECLGACFKLRLDEGDHGSTLLQKPGRCRKYIPKGQEGNIRTNKIKGRKLLRTHIPDVHPLQVHHPEIPPELLGKLIVPHVQGIHPCSTIL